jgi:hypothetical protein
MELNQRYHFQEPYNSPPTRCARFRTAAGTECRYWSVIALQACVVPAVATFTVISVGLMTLRAFGFTFALDVKVSV